MNKRFLRLVGFLILVTFLLVGTVGLGATAETTDPRYFEFDRSTGKITGYDTAGRSDVVIPSRIDGVKVEKIGYAAFTVNYLTSVELPEELEEIGYSAFSDSALTSVEIPESVEIIRELAFSNNNLTSIEIGEGVDIVGNAFEGNFREVYENNNKAAGEYVREDMDSDWHYRGEVGTEEELETTDPRYFEFDRSTGTITGYDTAGESDLVIPSRIDGVVVEVIGERAFQNCNLTSVEIPESVEAIREYAFSENELTSVAIPDGVEVIGEAAFPMNGLTSVEIGDDVKVIGRMAFARNNLTSVDIGEGVKVIKEGAFKGNNLTSVEIPDGVEEIGEGAFGYNELISVKIPSGVDITGDTIGGNFKRIYLDNNEAAGKYLRKDTDSDWRYSSEDYEDSDELNFPDPNLEGAIKEKIDWPDAPSRLQEVSELDLSKEGITNLSGMENLSGLTALNLAENEIDDLSPLKALEKLESLILTSNQIEDLSPLKGLDKLKILWLQDNEITDISPLLKLEELSYLRLEENPLDLAEGSQALQDIRRLEERGVEVEYE